MSGKVSHGNTIDAWTGVILLLIGIAAICFGVVFAAAWLWIPGVVICIGGVVAWIGMNRAGMTKELW